LLGLGVGFGGFGVGLVVCLIVVEYGRRRDGFPIPPKGRTSVGRPIRAKGGR